MNYKGPIIILALLSAALAIALIVVSKGASDQKKDADEKCAVASNKVTSITRQRDELQTVNQTLETNLVTVRAELSNKLALADANLHTLEANLEKEVAAAKSDAKAQADSNAVVLAQRDQKIAELESQNSALDKEAAALRASISDVQARIAATQDKLAKSEGNRDLLLKELKQLRSEKEDMEKRFNTIEIVRTQLRKLRTDAAIAQRMDWMREGVYGSSNAKGGERLIHPFNPVPAPAGSGANVELKQSGAVNIQTTPSTNAPPK